MTSAFILASASPRRLDLLRQIGREPGAIAAADVDEKPLRDERPAAVAVRLAEAKARAVQGSYPGQIILGADTIVACGARMLPKAETEAEARACINMLSGRRHRVHGGIAVLGAGGHLWTRAVMTQVRFKRLTADEIDAYIATDEWRGKAGGYAIQGRAAAFISAINGSYTNVVGLCVATVEGLLAAAESGHGPA